MGSKMGQKEPAILEMGKHSGWKGLANAGLLLLSTVLTLNSCQAIPTETYRTNQAESGRYISSSRNTDGGYKEFSIGNIGKAGYTQPQNEKGRYGVFLIDMQPLFLENIDKEELRNEIPNQIEVLKYAQRNKIPIFVLEYGNSGGGTIQELNDVLSKSNYELIIKNENNGFEGTSLNSKLEEYGIKEVILMGVNSCSCVKDTAIGALDNGYGIVTSPDVIAESEGVEKFFKTGECIDWYTENGMVLENYSDLIEYLEKNDTRGMK
jgi:hypothetical protein